MFVIFVNLFISDVLLLVGFCLGNSQVFSFWQNSKPHDAILSCSTLSIC